MADNEAESAGPASLPPRLSDAELDAKTKKEVLALLQQTAPREFLKRHSISGKPAAVAKRQSAAQIKSAYTALYAASKFASKRAAQEPDNQEEEEEEAKEEEDEEAEAKEPEVKEGPKEAEKEEPKVEKAKEEEVVKEEPKEEEVKEEVKEAEKEAKEEVKEAVEEGAKVGAKEEKAGDTQGEEGEEADEQEKQEEPVEADAPNTQAQEQIERSNPSKAPISGKGVQLPLESSVETPIGKPGGMTPRQHAPTRAAQPSHPDVRVLAKGIVGPIQPPTPSQALLQRYKQVLSLLRQLVEVEDAADAGARMCAVVGAVKGGGGGVGGDGEAEGLGVASIPEFQRELAQVVRAHADNERVVLGACELLDAAICFHNSPAEPGEEEAGKEAERGGGDDNDGEEEDDEDGEEEGDGDDDRKPRGESVVSLGSEALRAGVSSPLELLEGLGRSGLLFALVSSLRKLHASADVCLAVNTTLWSLIVLRTLDDAGRAEVMEHNITLAVAFGAIPLQVRVLGEHKEDARIVVATLRVLHSMLFGDQDGTAKGLVDEDAVGLVANVHKSMPNDALVQHHSLLFFSRVLPAPGCAGVCERHGVIQSTTRALEQHAQDHRVVLAALCCLAVAMVQDDCKAEAARAVVASLGLIVQTMRAHKDAPHIQYKACNVVTQACVLGHSVEAGKAQAVPAAVGALESFPTHAKVQEHGLALLWSLVTFPDTRAEVVGHAPLGIALRAMEQNKGECAVERMAVGLLRGTCYDDSQLQQQLVDSKGLAHIAQALRAGFQHSPLANECIHVLYLISKNTGFVAELRKEEVVPLLVKVLKAHPDDADLQNWGLSVLWNCSVDEEGCREVFKQGVDPIVSAMRRFPDNADIQEDCLNLLWNMAFHSIGTKELRASGALELTKRAIAAHDKLKGRGEHLLKRLDKSGCVIL